VDIEKRVVVLFGNIKIIKMVYVSCDIETTGLDFKENSVLSIGAIVEDTEKKLPYDEIPKFYGIVLQNLITGSPRAITMNQEVISNIGDFIEGKPETRDLLAFKTGGLFLEKDFIIQELYRFLCLNVPLYGDDLKRMEKYVYPGDKKPTIDGSTRPITINVAGKNFGTFDKVFLEQLPWYKKLIKTRQRILDPAILLVDWKSDDSLPNLKECKERAGVSGIVTHNALEDAWDVIEVLRKFY
jgi:oligoribonuclease